VEGMEATEQTENGRVTLSCPLIPSTASSRSRDFSLAAPGRQSLFPSRHSRGNGNPQAGSTPSPWIPDRVGNDGCGCESWRGWKQRNKRKTEGLPFHVLLSLPRHQAGVETSVSLRRRRHPRFPFCQSRFPSRHSRGNGNPQAGSTPSPWIPDRVGNDGCGCESWRRWRQWNTDPLPRLPFHSTGFLDSSRLFVASHQCCIFQQA